MEGLSEASLAGPLSPSRIVYHRGGYIYARFKAGGPDDYRHPLDVPNGRECGCVCDECGEDLVAKANIEGKKYEKEPHFAHQMNTRCHPSGERGLLEAFRLVIEAKRRLVLPSASFTLKGRDVLFQIETDTEVSAVAVAPRETGMPHELNLTTPKGLVRLWVVPKRLAESAQILAKNQSLPVVLAFVPPDSAGAIYMRDVLHVVAEGRGVSWIHHPEMERYAAEERKKLDAEGERLRQEAEQRMAAAKAKAAEEARRVEDEAKALGYLKLKCVKCKSEKFGPRSGEMLHCPGCRRMNMFFADLRA